MITDIVGNGCSYFWGQELKNRDSRFAKIISNSFNANLHDISMPGNCNQLICTDTIDKVLDLMHNEKIPAEKIFVIINWSFLDRIGYYNQNTDKIITVMPYDLKKDLSEHFYTWYIRKWYDDHGKLDYVKYSAFNFIFYLQSFLISNKIKYIFAFADETVHDFLKLKKDYACELNFKSRTPHRTSIENILKTIDTNYFYLNLNISLYKKLGFKFGPNFHPLEDSHAHFAEELIDFILEKYPNV